MLTRYPFLKSQWALIGECRSKISAACQEVLSDTSLSAPLYAGALVAEQVVNLSRQEGEDSKSAKLLDQLTASYLSSRHEWILSLSKSLSDSKDQNPEQHQEEGADLKVRERLHLVLQTLQKIIADGSAMFVQRPAGQEVVSPSQISFLPLLLQPPADAEPAAFEAALTEWLDLHAEAIARLLQDLLIHVRTLDHLAIAKETLLIAMQDFPGWSELSVTKVHIDVFERFFDKPFTARAHELAAGVIGDEVDALIAAFAKRATLPEKTKVKAKTQQHDVVWRSRTVIRLASHLDLKLEALLASIDRIDVHGSLVGTCRSAVERLFAWVAGTCTGEEGEAKDEEKDPLLVGRMCEALQCCRHLERLCGDWPEKRIFLHEMAMEVYEKWGKALLYALSPGVKRLFQEEAWEFPGSWRETHGGWEEIEVDLSVDGDEDEEMELDQDEEEQKGKEAISLPTVVSPSVFQFLFAVNGSLAQLGDPFTFKSLHSNPATSNAGMAEPEAEDAAYAKLEAACLQQFAKSNEKCRQRISSIALKGKWLIAAGRDKVWVW